MADDVVLNSGSGGDTIAADEIGGVKHQRVKLQYGTDGNATDVSTSAPLPVDVHGVAIAISGEYVLKFGRNPDVDAAEDIWEGGGAFPYPTSAESLELLSGSADDTSAGTGAQTVQVQGLGASWEAQAEIVSMNGVTAVDLVNTYRRIFRMRVLSAGSGGVNAGALTLRVDGGGATRATMTADYGQTLIACYTVPADKTGYLVNYYAGLNKVSPQGATADIQLYARNDASTATPAWNLKHHTGLALDGTSYVQHRFALPLIVSEKSDIRVHCASVSTTDLDISAGFDLILRDN